VQLNAWRSVQRSAYRSVASSATVFVDTSNISFCLETPVCFYWENCSLVIATAKEFYEEKLCPFLSKWANS